MRLHLKTMAVLAACVVAAGGVYAQEKKEEEPFWAKGKPKEGPGAKMAPVAAPPIPMAADKLPKLKAPPGFKVEVYQSGVLDARGLRRGDKGTIFVSSLFVAGKIYAITEKGGKRELKTVLSGLELPSGIEFRKGALYVATPKQVTRYDNIEDNLDKPPQPVVVYDKLPGDIPHGWKFLRFGPDDKLYVPIGAPCNICDAGDRYTQIFRINPDGSGMEVVARGVRNTVGFDFHPKTKELWFTDNQRDWLAEDFPLDELNRLKNPGKDHFGYPYCHSGTMTDPEFGWGKSCADYVKPAALLGPHMAPLGMRFYTGKMFPPKYQGAIFIARHGPWNRTKKDADVSVAYLDATSRVTRVEPFLTGWVSDNQYLGRPVDLLTLPDGSMLVSDDHAGAVYRVSYGK
ncbi:MAG: PQQ-dependent sugar dehydrogenase [Hyphomonadaceae bacterium]|jgi:glucose/arabinose dehydrogenase|nr:PQQ-dependent sugar dehydrogenase [Hyphomonadaceae bacterium]